MSLLAWILAFTVLGGVLSALAASSFLLLSAQRRDTLVPHLVSFATGTLLGAALLGLLPRALEGGATVGYEAIGLTLLAGIIVFFTLEKFVLWRHCHDQQWHDAGEGGHAHHHEAASGPMILVGDALHNALDGFLIATAFLTDIRLGIATGVAVIAHEIPQEVGDLAVLLNAGMHRARALTLNLLVSLTSVVGGAVGYAWLAEAQGLLPYALAVAASSFIYIAVADLIPGLHRRFDLAASVQQLALIGLGTSVFLVVHRFVH